MANEKIIAKKQAQVEELAKEIKEAKGKRSKGKAFEVYQTR